MHRTRILRTGAIATPNRRQSKPIRARTLTNTSHPS